MSNQGAGMPRKPRRPGTRAISAAAALLAPSRTTLEMARVDTSPPECRLAYGLETQFGRVCSRMGGDAVCGECIRDPDAPALGFRRVRS